MHAVRRRVVLLLHILLVGRRAWRRQRGREHVEGRWNGRPRRRIGALDGSVTNNCTLDSPVVAGSTETSSAATDLDSVVTGFLDLYGYTNIKLATAKCVRIYIEKLSTGNGTVPQVLIGVYSDSLGHPATLLAQASFTAAIGWNAAPLNIPVSFNPTATVWIGATVSTGEISARSRNGVYCAALPKFHNVALPSFALPATLVNPMPSSSFCQAAFALTE